MRKKVMDRRRMRHAAGAILYRQIRAEEEGGRTELEILLGKQHSGWSTFGGKGMEGETLLQTAARELHEEMRGVIPIEMAMKALHECPYIDSLTPTGKRFRLYALDWTGSCTDIPVLFKSVCPASMPKCYNETLDVAWVKWSCMRRVKLRHPLSRDIGKIYSFLVRLSPRPQNVGRHDEETDQLYKRRDAPPSSEDSTRDETGKKDEEEANVCGPVDGFHTPLLRNLEDATIVHVSEEQDEEDEREKHGADV